VARAPPTQRIRRDARTTGSKGISPEIPDFSPTPGTPSALFVLKRNHPITPTLCQRKTSAVSRRMNDPNILSELVYR
jgi:hypothetical protein